MIPKTADGLRAAGYEFINGGVCRGCRARISWYSTPKGKSIPLDVHTYEPHWSTCPNADDFRKKKAGNGD